VKFAHISDTHIKNLKYHYEYRIVFDQLYDELRKQEVDYIIHCGDIAHTKTQISPEFVEMCSDFFRNLAAIAPTYIILGNHDGNLKNSSRQDALTPIVEALDLQDLHLLKDSGETHIDDKFCLNVLSVFDRANWIKPTDDSKINIALYHGSISNCKTDTNWTMAHGEDNIDIFGDFDFSMLGDIHRRQFLDETGRVWYAGSTIQQNHGETNDKGILIWEIEDKDNWDIEPIVFKNPRPFITIVLTRKGRMPKGTKVPESARLRLVSNNNLPLNVMKRAVDIAKHRFKPESISFLNRASGERGNVEELTNSIEDENLRDINVQEQLIKKYLTDYETSDDMLERVYELNRKYNKIIEETEEISRNINWKLSNFEFDNLFNYDEGNSVNFEQLGGIVGIFGKNFTGKSSIVDAVLWTLFNTTSKNERKNLNVINQNKDSCRGKLTIAVGSKTYTIERTAQKYVKRLKGEETLEAKTDLNFEVYDISTDIITSLNGLTRNHTDANIRKHFGTLEDFSVSSLASQHGALSFIDEGSTRRKEIIAKFLDLEVFDKKFKLSKEDSVETKVILKKLEGRPYDEEIVDIIKKLQDSRSAVDNAETLHVSLNKLLEKSEESMSDIIKSISEIPTEAIDIFDVRRELQQSQKQINVLSNKVIEEANLLKNEKDRLIKINKLLGQLDYDSLLTQQKEIREAEAELASLTVVFDNAMAKEKLLDDIPCGTQFQTCKFIKDAHVAVSTLPEIKTQIHEFKGKLSHLSPAIVRDHIEKYTKLNDKKQGTEVYIRDLKLSIERNNGALDRLNNSVFELRNKELIYEGNKETIENLEKLLKEKTEYENGIAKYKRQIEDNREQTLDLYKHVGSYEQQLKDIKEQQAEYIELRKEFAAYDLFTRCMHSNGIAYDIIKKKIPVINGEIAKVLANIVDFEVFFETSGNKFDIFIKHPQYDERPIEMASGAEKTMSAMAIRLALLSVSSLPKSDLFILDEPGTALDEENMEGFIRILELIKVYFKNVLLISHLDSLKDCVDMQIVIEKKAGYARVNQ